MQYEIEMLAAENAKVGEGPLWVQSEQVLYWTDIQTGRCFRYNPADGSNERTRSPTEIDSIGTNRFPGTASI